MTSARNDQVSPSSKASCPEPGYWTAQHLATFVNRPLKTVYKWPELYADMPCARIGRSKLFPIERTKRWLERQEQGRPSSQRMRSSPNPASTNGAAHA
jgi:hypothetical protein